MLHPRSRLPRGSARSQARAHDGRIRPADKDLDSLRGARTLFDRDDTVNGDAWDSIPNSAGPEDLDLVHLRGGPEPKCGLQAALTEEAAPALHPLPLPGSF